MRVLLSNDDGFDAPGIRILESIVLAMGWEPIVIAPEIDCSGASRAITLSDPLRVRRIDENHYAVKGKPADCVILGLLHILPEFPDLVLTGVNRGQNVADDITASGTIGGAMEGIVRGIPSIAFSQAYSFETRANPYWDTAEYWGPKVIALLLKDPARNGSLYNVNFPDCPPDEVEGLKATFQGQWDGGGLAVNERMDGRGNPYFWLTFTRRTHRPSSGSDLDVINRNQISITPLNLGFTSQDHINALDAHLGG